MRRLDNASSCSSCSPPLSHSVGCNNHSALLGWKKWRELYGWNLGTCHLLRGLGKQGQRPFGGLYGLRPKGSVKRRSMENHELDGDCSQVRSLCIRIGGNKGPRKGELGRWLFKAEVDARDLSSRHVVQ